MDLAGTRIALHSITPALFGGYRFDSRVDGFLATSEKAVSDLAYLKAMSRSRVSATLPETDLSGQRWKDVFNWLRLIPASRMREAVERNLERMRQQYAADAD